MKIRIVIAMMGSLLALCFSGCKQRILPKRNEIDNLLLVQAVGIDRSADNPEKVVVTIASKRIEDIPAQGMQQSEGQQETTTGGKGIILSVEGDTIFDAVRKIQTHSDRFVFWGHAAFYLIGEEAAKENITKYIDFFARDHELRMDAKIYIVKDSDAKSMMEEFNKTDVFILDKLESIGRNVEVLSTSKEMEIFELMRFLDIHHSAARVPCLQPVIREGENDRFDIEINGYAIFSDLKLAGYIEKDISRGVNLITDDVGSSIVAVKDQSGQNISLEITSSKTKVEPKYKGNELLEITLKTEVQSNLGEVQSQEEVLTEDSIYYLEQQQSQVLKHEMEAVIKKALELKSDCLNICDKIRLKTPLKWHHIEKDWPQIIQKVVINVEVTSKIKRTYDLQEATGYK